MHPNLKRFLVFAAVLAVCGLIVNLPGTTEQAGSDSVWLKVDEAYEAIFRSKPNWGQVMNGVRLILALGAALFLMLETRARAFGDPFSDRMRKGIALAVTIIGFLSYYDFFNPATRYLHYYHRHEYFHYYLGSKYFQELGYYRLYDCVAVAEIDNGRLAKVRGRDIRDLRVNELKQAKNYYIVEPEKAKKACQDHFTPDRWKLFRKEVDFFYHSANGGSYYEGMMKDHGYNPPPVWTMQGKLVGSLAPVDIKADYDKDHNGDGKKDHRDYPHHAFFKWLSCIDVVLQASMFLLLWWAFGWRVTMVASVMYGASGAENFGFYWTGGAFLRMDWIFFLVAALCLAKKRWFWLAGAALMWSSLLRVFPAILFFGWGVLVLMELHRRRGQLVEHLKKRNFLGVLPKHHWQLMGGAVAAMAILVPASAAITASDPTSLSGIARPYTDFVNHIRVHKDTPLTNQMGLETVLVHNWEGRMRFTQDESLDDPFQEWKAGRTRRAEEMKPVKYAILALFALWGMWAMRRLKLLWAGVPLGLPLAFGMTNLTCYYHVMFITAAALVSLRPAFGPAMLATSAASLILVRNHGNTFYFIDDKYAALSWLFFIFSFVILFAVSRPFSMDRLLAWWRNEPEPTGNGRRQKKQGPDRDESEAEPSEAPAE